MGTAARKAVHDDIESPEFAERSFLARAALPIVLETLRTKHPGGHRWGAGIERQLSVGSQLRRFDIAVLRDGALFGVYDLLPAGRFGMGELRQRLSELRAATSTMTPAGLASGLVLRSGQADPATVKKINGGVPRLITF